MPYLGQLDGKNECERGNVSLFENELYLHYFNLLLVLTRRCQAQLYRVGLKLQAYFPWTPKNEKEIEI